MFEKLINFIKSYIIPICCLIIAFIIIAVASIFLFGNESTGNEKDGWGTGITKDIPEFSGEMESFDNPSDGQYAAVYYSGVTVEEAEAYIAKLESECGVEFSGSEYPRSAIFGEKIIVIHYNNAESRFSVTVAAKDYGSN